MKYYHQCVLGIPKRIKPVTLLHKAQVIQSSLSKPEFAAVEPAPAEVNIIIAQLNTAQNECTEKNYKFVPLRNALQERLREMLRLQCHCVNAIAQGQEEILIRSGFPLKKEASPLPVPEMGTMIAVSVGHSENSLNVEVKPLKNKSYYMVELRQADGVTLYHTSLQAKMVIQGVAQDMDIAVRVCGANSSGNGPWSEWVTTITPRTSPRKRAFYQNDSDAELKVA